MSAYSTYTDQKLTALLKEGDQYAFTEVYNRYKNPLFLHALRMLGDDEEAKDVVQELFSMLWVKHNALKVTTTLDAYLYGAVRNRIINAFAHKKVMDKYVNSLDGYLEEGVALTDEKIREKELLALIEHELAQLPAKMREVFELSRNQELSHKQIAKLLNISDKTVKKHVNNALKILRLKLNLSVFMSFFG